MRSVPSSSWMLAQSHSTATGWKLPHCLSSHAMPVTLVVEPSGSVSIPLSARRGRV